MGCASSQAEGSDTQQSSGQQHQLGPSLGQQGAKYAVPVTDEHDRSQTQNESGSNGLSGTASCPPSTQATTTTATLQSDESFRLKKDAADAAALVHSTLDRITKLMQAFAGVKAERSTSLLLRRLLDLILTDVSATFACVQAFAPDGSMSLLVASVGSPEWSDKNRVQSLGKEGARQAAEVVWGNRQFLEWNAADGDDELFRLPSDWQLLLSTMPHLKRISAAPIFIAEELTGVLTIATNSSVQLPSSLVVWRSYMLLLAANIATRLKDSAILQHLGS
ncbi:hypothetical protein FOA52_011342 [Chlamydomonas sp. UWO 241]|nr:hypothetical protein FOA52_011342 [Chlamydomonas sp. UWO 241]